MKIAIALLVLTVRIVHADVIAIDVTLNGDQRTIVDEAIAGTNHRVITFQKPEQVVAAMKRDKRVIVVSEKTLGLQTLAGKLAASGITLVQARPDTLAKALAVRKRVAISVVFVIDRGWSMKGKLDAAKQLVRDVTARLAPEDAIGITVFETEANIAAPLTRDRVAITKALQRIDLGVGSLMFAGMKEAHEMLEAAKGRKHVVVISDGDGVVMDGIAELVDSMHLARTDVSIVVAGPDLERMRSLVDGSFDLTKQTAAQIVQRLQ